MQDMQPNKYKKEPDMDSITQYPVELLEASDNEMIPVEAYIEYAEWGNYDLNDKNDLYIVIQAVFIDFVAELDDPDFGPYLKAHPNHYTVTANYAFFAN
jgi:hypothetical protein